MLLHITLLAGAFNAGYLAGYAAAIVLPMIVLILLVRGISSLIRQRRDKAHQNQPL
ncbi:MAG: hypothetical protein WDO15_10290 [Bacteroidota bacterium]